MARPRSTAIPTAVPNARTFGRRSAATAPVLGSTAVEARLATLPAPQWAQTGAQSSTNDGVFGNLTVTGTENVTNLSVSSSFTVQSSALKSMAFQSSTGVSITGGSVSAVNSTSILLSGSSINSTPIGASTPSTGKFTELYSSSTAVLASIASTGANLSGGSLSNMPISGSSGSFTNLTATGTVTFGQFTSSTALTITGSVSFVTSTGLSGRLLVSTT